MRSFACIGQVRLSPDETGVELSRRSSRAISVARSAYRPRSAGVLVKEPGSSIRETLSA